MYPPYLKLGEMWTLSIVCLAWPEMSFFFSPAPLSAPLTLPSGQLKQPDFSAPPPPLDTQTLPPPAPKVTSRELFLLQQRKNKIVSQLERVVGKQLASAISSQVRVS